MKDAKNDSFSALRCYTSYTSGKHKQFLSQRTSEWELHFKKQKCKVKNGIAGENGNYKSNY